MKRKSTVQRTLPPSSPKIAPMLALNTRSHVENKLLCKSVGCCMLESHMSMPNIISIITIPQINAYLKIGEIRTSSAPNFYPQGQGLRLVDDSACLLGNNRGLVWMDEAFSYDIEQQQRFP